MSAGIVDDDEQRPTILALIGAPKTPNQVASAVRTVQRVQTVPAPATSVPVSFEDRRSPGRGRPLEPGERTPPRPTMLTTDPAFVLTSELAAIRRESPWRFAKSVVGRRTELRRALARVRVLPRLTVPVSDTEASRDLTQLLRKRVGPFHYRSFAVAVLEVPAVPGAYRKGRSRQALRTNSAKALADGTSCVTLSGPQEILHRFDQVIVDGWGVQRGSRKYRKWIRNVESVPQASYFAALTEKDKTQVFSKLIVAGDHARLHTFIQNGDQAASNARFLLTEHMVESLGARGVKYLLVDTILGLPGGLRYLQHLLGYRPYNVTLTREQPVRRRRAGRAARP